MSDEMEVGTCEVCGKENVVLDRTYFNYDISGIKCSCHNPNHFVLVRHCKDCKPKEPSYTKIEFRTDDLKKLVELNNFPTIENAMHVIIQELSKDKLPGSYYHTWQSNIACAAMDYNVDHEIANMLARKFLDQLIYQPDDIAVKLID
jgi:hypothetical protein